nr:hypothetical protein L204_01571 [Cryptococcus depauperatus CBS 7855]
MNEEKKMIGPIYEAAILENSDSFLDHNVNFKLLSLNTISHLHLQVSAMTLLSSILGFSAFGLGVRCLQLGIQKRPIFEAFHGHVYSMIGFGILGAGMYHVELKQYLSIFQNSFHILPVYNHLLYPNLVNRTELLAQKKEVLLKNRERENREWEAQKAQAHAI